jgi:hypothetical protein
LSSRVPGRLPRIVTVGLLLLIAAPVSAQSPSPSGSPAPAGASTAPPEASLASQFAAKGLSDFGAAVAALSTVEVTPIDETGAHIVVTLPTGSVADLAATTTPGEMGATATSTVTISPTDTGYAFVLTSFVPYSDMPPDVVTQITGGRDAAFAARAALTGVASDISPLAEGGLVPGLGSVVKGIWSAVQGHANKQAIKALEAATGLKVPPEVGEAIRTGKIVLSTANLMADYVRMLSHLSDLERCVLSPTNRLTRDAYAADPSVQKALVAEIERTISSITDNSAAQVLATLIGVINRLVEGPGWLANLAIGRASEDLKSSTAQEIAAIEAAVVPCDGYMFHLAGHRKATFGGTTRTIEWDYTGALCPTEEVWKLWEHYDGFQDSVDTARPSLSKKVYHVDFNRAGEATRVYVKGLAGQTDAQTWAGTGLDLTIGPDHKPTGVTMRIPLVGGQVAIDSASVVPLDGSFPGCDWKWY